VDWLRGRLLEAAATGNTPSPHRSALKHLSPQQTDHRHAALRQKKVIGDNSDFTGQSLPVFRVCRF